MPQDIWDLITLCWDQLPEERPSTSTVVRMLKGICGYALPLLLEPLTPEALGDSQSVQTLKPSGIWYTAAISSNLKLIGSGRSNGVVGLWDTESGRTWQLSAEQNLPGSSTQPVGGKRKAATSILCLAFSPDNQYIVGGSKGGDLYLWNFTGQSPIVFEGHTDAVRKVEFSPDGRTIASGSDDRTMRIWDVKSRDSRLVPCSAGVLCLTFSPDGKFIASKSQSTTNDQGGEVVVAIWDLDELGGPVRQFPVGLSDIRGLVWSPDGLCLAATFADGHASLLNALSGAYIQLKSPQLTDVAGGKSVEPVAFSPDGKHVAIGGEQIVQVWDGRTGSLVAGPFLGHSRPVVSIQFSPSAKFLVSVSTERIRVWSIPYMFVDENLLSITPNQLTHPDQSDSSGTNASQIPEIPPSPLQYVIDLVTLEEREAAIPHHEPEPAHFSIELNEEEIPPNTDGRAIPSATFDRPGSIRGN